MDRRTFLCGGAAAAAVVLAGTGGFVGAATGDGQIVNPPAPDITGGKALMACLQNRRTNRALGREDLDPARLSNVLWAAWGINRTDGRHVIPTARNRRDVVVYAVRGDGVWEYLPADNAIKRVINGDQRGLFDGAGLILLYAAPADARFAGMHVGSMYQNVGLYCASAGLANCVKHSRHNALDAQLPLPQGWMVYITQSVAEPAAV